MAQIQRPIVPRLDASQLVDAWWMRSAPTLFA